MTHFCILVAFLIANDPTTFINQYFVQHWRENQITPSATCSDHEFLRRASLDLIGRIPTVPEIDAFFKDPSKVRRRLLIDRLLKHEESPRHWADVWTHWLLDPSSDMQARYAFHSWLQQHFAKNGSHEELAWKLLTARGTIRDNPAGHFIVAHRGQMFPEKDWRRSGQYDMLPLTVQVARVFHGRRLLCAQCHDHPLDHELGQQHFYGINGFFTQVEFKHKQVGNERNEEIGDNPELNRKGIVGYVRRNAVVLYTDPTFLDGSKPTPGNILSRREFLADRLVQHLDFARAYVNRMWAYFFGHDLCHSPEGDVIGNYQVSHPQDGDDIGSRQVVHAKLMDRLAREFIKSGYDPKALVRAICLSDCYSLSCVANKTNAAPDRAVAFARQQLRPLSNEQIVASVMTATLLPQKDRENRRAVWLKELHTAPIPAPSECEFEPRNTYIISLSHQSRWMMNSKAVNESLRQETGTVAALARRKPKITEEAVEALFLHALSRPQSRAEIARFLAPGNFLPESRAKANPDTSDFLRSYYEDVFWALLNSGEFALNH